MDENLEESQTHPSSFENLDNPSPYQNPESSYTPPPSRKRSPKKLLYALAGVILVLILLNVVRSLGSKAKSSTPSPTPTVSLETSTPAATESGTSTPAPTATPKPSVNPVDKTSGLDRSKLSVSVQNGSGEAGVAQKAADVLRNLGYNVVSTGNADNFNYTNVTIKVKPAQKDFLPVLNKDLSSNGYSIGTTSTDLTATSSADALVIVGK